jgi:hypothetical protein
MQTVKEWSGKQSIEHLSSVKEAWRLHKNGRYPRIGRETQLKLDKNKNDDFERHVQT